MDHDLVAKNGFGVRAAVVIFIMYVTTIFIGNFLTISSLKIIYTSLFAVSSAIPEQLDLLFKELANLFGSIISLFVAGFVYITYFQRTSFSFLLSYIGEWKARIKILVATYAASLLSVVLLVVIANIVYSGNGSSEPLESRDILEPDFITRIIVLVSAILVAPVAEEIVFRGILFKAFSNSFGQVLAGFFVMLLFVLVHKDTLTSGSIFKISGMVFFGILLSIARIKSSTLILPIVMHSGLNSGVLVNDLLGQLINN